MNTIIRVGNEKTSFVRFNIFGYILLFLLFSSCNFGKTQKYVSLYPNGKSREQYYYFVNNKGDTIKTGRYRLWSENGRKIKEGRYFNGEKENIWKEWTNNNKKILFEYWFKDKRYGLSIKWDDQGNLIEKGDYIDDLKDGEWIEQCVTTPQIGLAFQKNKYQHGKLIWQSACEGAFYEILHYH